MAFTRVTADPEVITVLPTRPNSGVDGLSPSALKEKFDEFGKALKTYLNNTLCAELEASTAAGNIGIDTIDGLVASTVQGALEALVSAINDVTVGVMQDGSITTAKLASSAVTAGKLASNAVETAKINDGAVTAGKLASSAVETAKINDGAVTAAKIAAAAVTNEKLGSGAVKTANLAAEDELLIPLNKGGTGAKTAAAARTALGAQVAINVTSATLTGGDSWVSKSQDLTISGMTADSKFIAAPSDATSWDRADDAGLKPPTAGAGKLTFTCDDAPASGEDITVTVYWW